MSDSRRSAAQKYQSGSSPPQPSQPQQSQPQKSPKKSKKKKNDNSTTFFTVFTVVMVFALSISVALLPNDFSEIAVLGGERELIKSFKTFSDFYPYYLSQHADATNRVFHFIGTTLVLLVALFEPILIHCIIIAGCFGYISCSVFAGPFGGPQISQTGFLEALVFVSTFFFFAIGNKVFKKAAFIVALGYAFAWYGHFQYELNKPATFVYPTYSLMADLKLWLDMIVGTVPGLEQFPILFAPAIQVLQPAINVMYPYYLQVHAAVFPYYLQVKTAIIQHI